MDDVPLTPSSTAEQDSAADAAQRKAQTKEKACAPEDILLAIYRRQANSRGLFNMNNSYAMRVLGLTNRGVQLLAQRLRYRGRIEPTGLYSYRWRLTA